MCIVWVESGWNVRVLAWLETRLQSQLFTVLGTDAPALKSKKVTPVQSAREPQKQKLHHR